MKPFNILFGTLFFPLQEGKNVLIVMTSMWNFTLRYSENQHREMVGYLVFLYMSDGEILIVHEINGKICYFILNIYIYILCEGWWWWWLH